MDRMSPRMDRMSLRMDRMSLRVDRVLQRVHPDCCMHDSPADLRASARNAARVARPLCHG
jgi:hypothetical protein